MSSAVNRPTTVKAEAFGRTAVIFFHGSGGDGMEWKMFFDQQPLPAFDLLTFRQVLTLWTQNGNTDANDDLALPPTCDIICPTAEMRPYSPLGREGARVWHDRTPSFLREGMQSKEDHHGVTQSLQTICEHLVQLEETHGFEHYFIGGLSMGGGFALQFLRDLAQGSVDHVDQASARSKLIFSPAHQHTLHLFQSKIRGIFTAGSFLVQDSLVNDHKLPLMQPSYPVLMLHGADDDLISQNWGRQTAANLLVREVNVDFQVYPHVEHEMTLEQLGEVLNWMKARLTEYYRSSEGDSDRYHKHKARVQAASYRAMEKERYQDRFQYSGFSANDAAAASSTSSNTATASSVVSPTRKSSHTIDEYSRQQAVMKSEDHRHRVDQHPHGSHDADLDHLAYSIEYMDEAKQEESKLSMVAPRVRIRFDCHQEHILLLTSRPVLACGSMFEIKSDHPYGVKTEAHTNDPHRTAMEISKRLFIRIHSGSASLNPCQTS